MRHLDSAPEQAWAPATCSGVKSRCSASICSDHELPHSGRAEKRRKMCPWSCQALRFVSTVKGAMPAEGVGEARLKEVVVAGQRRLSRSASAGSSAGSSVRREQCARGQPVSKGRQPNRGRSPPRPHWRRRRAHHAQAPWSRSPARGRPCASVGPLVVSFRITSLRMASRAQI